MDTKRVFIGDVRQITNVYWIDLNSRLEEKTTKHMVKRENALLFMENRAFLDLETQESYGVNLSRYQEIGDVFVFQGDLTSINVFLDEQDRFQDIPEEKIIDVYQNIDFYPKKKRKIRRYCRRK